MNAPRQSAEVTRVMNNMPALEDASLARAKHLSDWMHQHFEWTANDYAPRTLDEILKRRAGHCGEMAAVLEVLLKAARVRVRMAQEINIHPTSKARQTDAEKLVAQKGNAFSVFGLRHNDHRWMEIYDDQERCWVPCDATLGLVGLGPWVKARISFEERPPAAADMLVPLVVLVHTEGGRLENRSTHYLIEAFNAAYNGMLERLAAWVHWRKVVQQLQTPTRLAFAGKTNLHEHAELIRLAKAAYIELKQQWEATV